MMSELGLVYFLDRTADRKMLNVCWFRGQQFEVTRQCPCQVGAGQPYIERVQIGDALGIAPLERPDRS